jgi:2-keto-4-pentenoate hydratase/2-oxohepta-3-ene-1,7-dioic acid hydratase in catechol pathway
MVDARIVDGADLGWPKSMRELLLRGFGSLADTADRASSLAESAPTLDAADVILGPPILDPGKIICVGLNYAAHVEESGLDVPASPELFAKFTNSLIGPHAAIVVPAAAVNAVDYEGELAVIIGRTARRLTRENALDHVVGYAVFNDVSARDLQMATSQWTTGKAVDTFGPFGPGITLRQDVDVQNLHLRTWVNGELMQDASTALMLNTVVDLLVYITSVMTLEPGDVIASGTPSGVGMGRDPQRLLADGDVVDVEIEHLGRISNVVTYE